MMYSSLYCLSNRSWPSKCLIACQSLEIVFSVI
jgi:hypothetical protein